MFTHLPGDSLHLAGGKYPYKVQTNPHTKGTTILDQDTFHFSTAISTHCFSIVKSVLRDI